MHYRTKGSKNGISRTKGYTAKGKLASKDPRIQQNNWQDIANQTAAQTEAANKRDNLIRQRQYEADDVEMLKRLANQRKQAQSADTIAKNTAARKERSEARKEAYAQQVYANRLAARERRHMINKIQKMSKFIDAANSANVANMAGVAAAAVNVAKKKKK